VKSMLPNDEPLVSSGPPVSKSISTTSGVGCAGSSVAVIVWLSMLLRNRSPNPSHPLICPSETGWLTYVTPCVSSGPVKAPGGGAGRHARERLSLVDAGVLVLLGVEDHVLGARDERERAALAVAERIRDLVVEDPAITTRRRDVDVDDRKDDVAQRDDRRRER